MAAARDKRPPDSGAAQGEVIGRGERNKCQSREGEPARGRIGHAAGWRGRWISLLGKPICRIDYP
jgi:hypothetical protein